MEQKIESTTNYNMFKFSDRNRKPSQQHVEDLAVQIKKNNCLDVNPILIDENNYVISGQHRLLAAQKLRVPIYYIRKSGIGNDYIIKSNLYQMRPTSQQAVDYYIAEYSLRPYIFLDRWTKRLGISLGAVASMIGNYDKNTANICNGTFELYYTEEETVKLLEKYEIVKNFMKSMPFVYPAPYKTKRFCSGFRKFMEEINQFEKFMLKLRYNWYLLDANFPSVDAWCERFKDVLRKRERKSQDGFNYINDED